MIDITADRILKLKKQLLPTGRAFTVPQNSDFEKLLHALSESEVELYNDSDNLLNSILPDNADFDAEDAAAWERVFALVVPSASALSDRKTAILQAMAYPNNLLNRQHYLFLQKQLQDAGFADLYVHEYVNVQGLFATFDYGDADNRYGNNIRYGAKELPAYESIVANFVDKTRETDITTTNEELRSTFWVGAQTFPNMVNVDASKEKQLRQLILKLKPIHTVCFLLVNYV